ncbi:hypothetical protein QUY26_36475 [Streptomyces flavofungini]|nr:hypothetical protein [Streptomyces flavofungini]WJV50525.1 hypothetical protein QUY26_36475 [Streptomyces flavofungini]
MRTACWRAGALRTGAEFLCWWVVLVALWSALISGVDAMEPAVGVGCGLAGASAATAARRAAASE